MKREEELHRLLTDTGAHRKGHFILSSGLHSGDYIQCALLLQYPGMAERAGRLLYGKIEEFRERCGLERPGFIVSPAIGGIIIGHEVARSSGVRFLFAEREREGKMVMRRGFSLNRGEGCYIVEDVMTTGLSTAEVADTVRGAGGIPLLASALVLRSEREEGPPLGIPIVAGTRMKFPLYPPESCPLCREGIPLSRPGSRK